MCVFVSHDEGHMTGASPSPSFCSSDLMKARPDLMMPALITHNNLLQKAKFTNFGYTLEQEGDSYSIMFHEAADAVKFCLQVSVDVSVGDFYSIFFSILHKIWHNFCHPP